jgi:hypothetical protein
VTANTVVYSVTATEPHRSSWGGETFIIRPVPPGLPGIQLLAQLVGLAAPQESPGLADAMQQAARDTTRLPQVRIMLRHGAAELRRAVTLLEGTEEHRAALTSARDYLVRAWQTLPGAWGFTLSPDGSVQCTLCGHRDPGTGTGYRAEGVAKKWYEQHAEVCDPEPLIDCEPCVLCGYCRTRPTAVHRCSPCTCHTD